MISLNTRLLLVASIILMLFFGITGATLSNMYKENAEKSQRNHLMAYVYEIINTVEFSNTGELRKTRNLPEVRFAIQHSGLYGQITQNNGKIIWSSDSSLEENIPFKYGISRGGQEFGTVQNSDGVTFYYYSFGISWDESVPLDNGYTFTVVETTESYDSDIASFQKGLWGSLSGVAFLLLLVQGLILRWGLSPLNKVTSDLKTIESGEKLSLEGKYPPEIRRLTDDLNALLHNHHENLKRYRQALGDLAHSLKTPLALLQSSTEQLQKDDPLAKAIEKQVDQMSQIIEYQLQRAATAGRTAFATAVDVKPVLKKITSSLNKVYADKNISLTTSCDDKTIFYGDRGDLMEIIGNLADNAYKWCNQSLTIEIQNIQTQSTRPGLTIICCDDGPGIPDNRIEQILQRGIRADENVGGHGIGMAIINDITNSYGGQVIIGRSKNLGGNRIEVRLPGS